MQTTTRTPTTSNIIRLLREAKPHRPPESLVIENLRSLWIDQFDPATKPDERAEIRVILRDEFVNQSEFYKRTVKFGTDMPVYKTQLTNPIIVPIMVSGFKEGTKISAQLLTNGTAHDFVMLGCSLKSHGNQFKSGEYMNPGEVYLSDEDKLFLLNNTSRPVLFVDDVLESGKTLDRVVEFVCAMGYRKFSTHFDVDLLYR